MGDVMEVVRTVEWLEDLRTLLAFGFGLTLVLAVMLLAGFGDRKKDK
jgi:hypothetical protein